ncbi:LLM class flavin-dependent oxidoreductase [Streptomyces sp. NBC_00414]|uniref:LLM class flavin-dependent oxidoreductase n=1 Tax=Streptomyces sp. NBC_00414 TaxID=2975739 RepID=UPI002E2369F8
MTVPTPAGRSSREPSQESFREQVHLAARFPDADGTTVRADPRSRSRTGLASFERLAHTAERGLFDFLLLPEGARLPEPVTVLNALAAVTERLGLAATVDTTFNEPFELARRLATLDHVSAGRAAWNVAVSDASLAGENFRRGDRPDHGDRGDRPDRGGLAHSRLRPTGGTETPLARAAEFVQVSRELWDSWTPDGIARPFAHRGRHFDIAGEFTVPRSPQGHPVVIRAGDSSEGREFAASTAEVIFTRHGTLEAGREFYADVKGRLAGYGRDHEDLKIMPEVAFVLGDTAAEARERAAEIRRTQEDPPSGPTANEEPGRRSFVGTPESVAAEIDESVRTGAADGFLLVPHPTPGGLDEFVDRVVPLLQERGLFRTEYTGTTLRSHLGLQEPVWKG